MSIIKISEKLEKLLASVTEEQKRVVEDIYVLARECQIYGDLNISVIGDQIKYADLLTWSVNSGDFVNGLKAYYLNNNFICIEHSEYDTSCFYWAGKAEYDITRNFLLSAREQNDELCFIFEITDEFINDCESMKTYWES